MTTLQIEHPILDFESWKKAFESDPIGRKKAGVRAYRIFRPIEDSKYVMIDLDFDDRSGAEMFLGKLRKLWTQVEGTILMNPQTRIAEMVETRTY